MTIAAIARPVGIALGCIFLGVAGCSPKIKAIEALGQTVLRKGKAAVIEREGLAVVLTPVVVGLEEDTRLVGMRIELLNQGDLPVRLALKDIILLGGDGMRRPPTDPVEFKRYAELSQGNPPPARSYRPVRVSVGVGRGHWYGYGYPHRDPYRYPHGPPYYHDDYYSYEEHYRRRERIARFVASLWTTKTIEPGFVANGHVVFDYLVRKKDALTVGLTIDCLAPGQATTQPSTAPTSQRAPVDTMNLVFHFET